MLFINTQKNQFQQINNKTKNEGTGKDDNLDGGVWETQGNFHISPLFHEKLSFSTTTRNATSQQQMQQQFHIQTYVISS